MNKLYNNASNVEGSEIEEGGGDLHFWDIGLKLKFVQIIFFSLKGAAATRSRRNSCVQRIILIVFDHITKDAIYKIYFVKDGIKTYFSADSKAGQFSVTQNIIEPQKKEERNLQT